MSDELQIADDNEMEERSDSAIQNTMDNHAASTAHDHIRFENDAEQDYDDDIKQNNLEEEETKYNMQNGDNTTTVGKTAWQTDKIAKLYNFLRKLEDIYGVKISVPEFVFMGFQSVGKTSSVSQAAKIAIGIIKTGTGSRCPTRFKLINNPSCPQKVIYVNNVIVGNEGELTDLAMKHTEKLEKEKRFSDEIFEVSIEWNQCPDLTFIDLPGLISSDEADLKDNKLQLEKLVSSFIHAKNKSGDYKYMPILVRIAEERENYKGDIERIDKIIKQYGTETNTRTEWKNDTLHIVNRFDDHCNYSTANDLIEFIKYCCRYGKTVITMMNPYRIPTTKMNWQELTKFIQNAENSEQDKLQEIIGTFHNDPDVDRLQHMINQNAGIPKMNAFIAQKMISIVKNILPVIEQKMSERDKVMSNEIRALQQKLNYCNPKKLKDVITNFITQFLQNCKEYYGARLSEKFPKSKRMTLAQELNVFYSSNSEFAESNLISVHTTIERLKHCKSKYAQQLSNKIEKRLIGGQQIKRIEDFWIARVALMPFPLYSDEDMENFCEVYDATRQPNVWKAVRNVVCDAAEYLTQCCIWLAEMFRMRLKINADLVFEYTLEQVFGKQVDKNLIAMLRTSLNDYKAELDIIINEFISVSEIVPKDFAEILDKQYYEQEINAGELIKKLLAKNSSVFAPKRILVPDNENELSQNNQLVESKSDDIKEENLNEAEIKLSEEELMNIDGEFYESIYCGKINQSVVFDAVHADIDIAQVRQLAYIFWIGVKKTSTRDISQKFCHRVMGNIRERYTRLRTAMLCGVKRSAVEKLVSELAAITGVANDVIMREVEKGPIELRKDINDMSDEAILKMYGVNIGQLKKEIDKKIKELNEFRAMQKETLTQIHETKNL